MESPIVIAPGIILDARMIDAICATYRIWYAMRKRCEDKKNKNYGGRGITVCERWRSSFPLFLQDMGPRPSEDLSLDRKDVNGNYEPDNCRWATDLEQMRNRRKFDYCSRGHLMAENRIEIIDYGVIGHKRIVCRRCQAIRNWETNERHYYERHGLPKLPPEEMRGDIFDCPTCNQMVPMQKLLVSQIQRGECIVTCRDNNHFLEFIERAPGVVASPADERRRLRDKLRKREVRATARGTKPKFKKTKLATHCKRGHALEGDNLYFFDTLWGEQRRCRKCQEIRNAKSRGKIVTNEENPQ